MNIADLKARFFGGGIDAEYDFYAAADEAGHTAETLLEWIPGEWTLVAPEVGASAAGEFDNSWVNFGGGFQPLRFRKIGTDLHIVGMIAGGADGTTVFALPEDCWPATNQLLDAYGAGGYARMDVTTTGLVQIAVGSAGHVSINQRFSLL